MSIEYIGRNSPRINPHDLSQDAMAAIISSYRLSVTGRPRVLMPSALAGIKSGLARKGLATKLGNVPGDRWALTEAGEAEYERLVAIYELEYAL